jgi:predicted dithiol-disulfide oxidoreductase (DUF899 family)
MLSPYSTSSARTYVIDVFSVRFIRPAAVRAGIIKERGIDELIPVWNMLDLTPQGRGTFYASLEYGTKVQIARG